MSVSDELPWEIDVRQVQSLLAKKQIVLVDCREESEWNTAHIDGAILLPMSQWEQACQRLADKQAERIVVHCHHGGRSLRVTRWLRENGYAKAQNMAGGIDAWSQEIDPAVPRY